MLLWCFVINFLYHTHAHITNMLRVHATTYAHTHTHTHTQAEYMAEGIEWSSVSFIDNQECLDLIAKKPIGLLPLLDEECRYVGMRMCVCVCGGGGVFRCNLSRAILYRKRDLLYWRGNSILITQVLSVKLTPHVCVAIVVDMMQHLPSILRYTMVFCDILWSVVIYYGVL